MLYFCVKHCFEKKSNRWFGAETQTNQKREMDEKCGNKINR
jgi:hypothetical protein